MTYQPLAVAMPGMRLLAYIIDLVILYGYLMVMVLLLRDVHSGLALLAFLPFVLGYSPFMTFAWGGTVGKRLCGLRVVRIQDGRPVSYGQALGRHLAHGGMNLIPILGIVNVLYCTGRDPNRQCLHDKLAGTMVIVRHPKLPGHGSEQGPAQVIGCDDSRRRPG